MALSRGHSFYTYRHTDGKCYTSASCSPKNSNVPWKIYALEAIHGPAALMTVHDNKCLDYRYNSNYWNVYMHNCHGGDNQKWYFDGQTLKTEHDNKCLDYHYNSNLGTVYMDDCHGGATQKWRFDGKTLKNGHGNKCLDYNYNFDEASYFETANVYMHHCNGGSNQKWNFLR